MTMTQPTDFIEQPVTSEHKALSIVAAWQQRALASEAAREADKVRHAAELQEQAERFSGAATEARKLASGTGFRRGVEAALDKARGTNADLCKSPGLAYRTILDALRALLKAQEPRHD